MTKTYHKREPIPKHLTDRQKANLRNKRWRDRHPERAADSQRKWRAKCPAKVKAYWTKYRDQVRSKLFALFGSICCRCGFSDPRALNLDHIHGAKEGRGHPYRGGWRLYTAVIRGHRDRAEFQLLCANCNSIKVWESGENLKNHGGSNPIVLRVKA